MIELTILIILLVAIVKPLGLYIANVLAGNRVLLSRLLVPLERVVYRWCGINPHIEQTWTRYAGSTVAFTFVSFLTSYVILRTQSWLPLNPQHLGTVSPDLAFNIAISFITNSSWQPYPGETTLSYLSQMLVLGAPAFTATATGIAVARAMFRGFAREKTGLLGNFWVDLTRCTLYIVLPLCLVAAILLCSQGVIQNLHPYQQATTVEGGKQIIAQGPVASWESIKLLSSGDGGGFFNASSAHPYENPTPYTNWFQMLLMLVIPAAMTFTFGRMVKDERQGWTLLAAMTVLFVIGCVALIGIEQHGNPLIQRAGIAGSNMEGKEVRFGIAGSAIFSGISTATSDGAMNSSHDSFAPLGGLVQIFNLVIGDVVFGGAGTGMISMILMVMLTVFIASLMVGRAPEYLSKKIEVREIKMAMLSYVATSTPLLILAAITMALHFHSGGYWNPPGSVVSSLGNRGPHGLTEILYANASAVHTNGSAFGGLNANTPWFNLTTGLEMLIGRFMLIIPALAIGGSLARKPRMAVTTGTLPTHGGMFLVLLLGSIVLLTVLTYLPALCLGPIVEHFQMVQGAVYP